MPITFDPTPIRRVRIKESQKPDVFTVQHNQTSYHFFINGVIRVEAFKHITPMTETQTEEFLEDYSKYKKGNMTFEELWEKYKEYALEGSEEVEGVMRTG